MSKAKFFIFDWQLLIPIFVLLIISLTTLFTLNVNLFRNQLFYLLISFFAFLFFSQTSSKVIKYYSFPIYIVSLILLSSLLVIGLESRGATRWVEIFGMQIQFSEVLKPFLSLALAAFLVRNKTHPKTFFLTFFLFFPLGLLIYLQPDLGNALLYAGVIFFTLLVFGFPLFWFLGGLVITFFSFPFAWLFLHEYQRQRILTFINPSKDPLGTSYNAIQSIIAVGSGMIFGKGLNEGTQSILRFLPERHTDFIFATLSENFGFIGSIIVIISFAFLLKRIYSIFSSTDDQFCKTFSIIAFFIILLQMFINISMNIGVIPVVGITLPFVSYGGSSLFSNFILIGFLTAIQSEMKREEVLEIR